MKCFVILLLLLTIRLISGNRFDSSANFSDMSDENHVLQKRFGFLKNLFGLGASDDNTGTVIIDRRYRAPKRKRRLRQCSRIGRRYRRPIYRPIIGRRNFDLAFNYAPQRPRYLGILPAFKQPPEDTYYYSFPNGLLDGNRNINLFEPAPGDLLYPPMTPSIIPKSKFNLRPKATKGPKLYPFYEHEAINLLQTKSDSKLDNLYRRDDEANQEPVYERRPNDILPSKYNKNKITNVTPSPVDKNILTLSKLINDRRKKTSYVYNNHYHQQQQQQHQQQNSQENLLTLNLINNFKSSRGNIVIPLKRTSNLSRGPHQSNYHHYPATKLFKNPLNTYYNHDRYQYAVGSGSGGDSGGFGRRNTSNSVPNNNNNNKTTRDVHIHDHYDTYNLQNLRHTHNKTILMNDVERTHNMLYTIDGKIGVQDDHPTMDQTNDERNYLKIYNIEPNYNWVNVDTKTVLGNTTESPQKYSSSIPATEDPIKANSIIAERTKIY